MAGCWVDKQLTKCHLNGKHWDAVRQCSWGFEVTHFSFIVGVLGHIPSSSGLSGTIGQQLVSAMEPRFETPACIAWGNWGPLIAPSFGGETVRADA